MKPIILRMLASHASSTLAGHQPSCGLRQAALQILRLNHAADKVAATHQLYAAQSEYVMDVNDCLAEPEGVPGRPDRPCLVPPKDVPTRSPFTAEGRAALLHAIAHIEFNAINLALDAVWRFPGMPEAYYKDWLQVASEEALHFTLLRDYLQTMGVQYGDFDAHDGLWQMTRSTANDITARMALVPRTLEARGLDATPPIQAKLRRAGDERAVEILDVILRDEVGHVAIGNHWYRWLCERDGHDAEALYPKLVSRYCAPKSCPPFNLDARRQAGFSEAELSALQAGQSGS